MSKKKRNIVVRFFCAIGRSIKNFFLWIWYLILYAIFAPMARCKVRGKENVSKTDEARVFISNHYEIFGPVAMYISFPYKFKPWVIDKLLDKKSVEEQMSISVYNNFKRYPMWFKRFAVHAVRNLMIYVMNHAGAISVSRDNIRANIKTLNESVKVLNKKKAVLIFPELSYVQEGVGEFQTGFEHLGKFYYQKTGKKISFYPTFVSQNNKEIYIGKPIIFNPDNDPNEEKTKIVSYLHTSMVEQYIENEVNHPEKSKVKPKKNKPNKD